MKKLVVIIFACLCSINVFCQTAYISQEFPELHREYDKHYVSYKECVKTTTYNVNSKPVCDELIYAGKNLKKSAICNYIAMGAVALGGMVGATYGNHDICIGDETATAIVAGAFGAIAIVSEILAINYKYKAGKRLKISAGKIQYNF